MESQNSATDVIYKLWPQIEANKNRIVTGVIILVVAVAAYSFYAWRREAAQVAAGEAATQTLLTVPTQSDPAQLARTYLAVAEDHPGTSAGARSLLEGAAVLFTQGKYSDAQTYFQQFIDSHPDDELTPQAALGVAKCLDAQGQTSKAQGEYQHVISDFADAQVQDEARFALAQLYLQQKDYASALQNFQAIAQSDPYSALGQESAQYAFELRSQQPAAHSVPVTPPNASFNLH